MNVKLLYIQRDTNIGYRVTASINGMIAKSDGVFTLNHVMQTFGLTKENVAKYIK